MVSPWQSPLPLEEHKTSRVVVYFYSDRLGLWIPIVFFQLVEAIALHHKGLFNGAEFFVFPPDLDPCNWGQGGQGGQGGSEVNNSFFPMPNALCPMPHAPCPIPSN